jgi:polar amino acid transport system substrate-binding protein
MARWDVIGGIFVTQRTKLRRAALVLAATALVVGAAGCAKEEATTTESGVKLVKDGKLTVCTHLPYAPFQFNEGGKVVGFDVDLMDLVAKELKVEQSIVDTPFEGIKSGQDLKTGKCDIAAAAMSITPERQKVIDFSEPYFNATQAMLVKAGAPYKSLADLKGKKVGAQAATTGLDYVKKESAANGYTVVDYKDLAAQQQALATGQIDAAVNDVPVWGDFIKKNTGKFVIAAEFDTGDQYGFGMKKDGNPELVKTVNSVLEKARNDGTYDKIYEKWIGTKPPSK